MHCQNSSKPKLIMAYTSITTHTSIVKELQAPLLSFAYTLTGDRTEAHNLLRDTNNVALAESDEYRTREGLFATMKRIYDSFYSSRADSRRMEISSRPYTLPTHAAMADAADEIPESTVTTEKATAYLNAILDRRSNRVMTMRAAGYRFREIAREEGITVFRARLLVAMASVSLRAAAALR